MLELDAANVEEFNEFRAYRLFREETVCSAIILIAFIILFVFLQGDKMIRILALWLIVAVVINMFMFALGRVSVLTFWSIIGLVGVLAYYVIPYYKENV